MHDTNGTCRLQSYTEQEKKETEREPDNSPRKCPLKRCICVFSVPLWAFSSGWRIDRVTEDASILTPPALTVDVDDVPSWSALPLLVRASCSVDEPDISSWESSFSDRAAAMLAGGTGDLGFWEDVSVERSIGAAPNICFQSSFCNVITHNTTNSI